MLLRLLTHAHMCANPVCMHTTISLDYFGDQLAILEALYVHRFAVILSPRPLPNLILHTLGPPS